MRHQLLQRLARAACRPHLACRLVVIAGALVPAWHGAEAQTTPPGFSAARLFATTTLNSPTALAFTPDGRMLIALQDGDLRIAQGGSVAGTPALTLGTRACSTSERGLLGAAVDPQFATNNFIYLFYTFRKFPGPGACQTGQPTSATNPVNRVSRFVLPPSNVVDPLSEVVLLDNIPSPNGNHNGGDLRFGKDGFLYVSIGDGGADYAGDSGSAGANDAARDKHVLLGKILRIDRDGGIPPGNPFQGANTGRCNVNGSTTPGNHCQETYAWGLRNPFRIAMDPNAAGVRFFINDVGQNNWEEIDEGQAGADYGWNCREGRHLNSTFGPCNPVPAGMVDPVFEYQHGLSIPGTTSPSTCAAITGGAFVPNGLWPNADGAYLAADYACGVIYRITKPAATWVASDFVGDLGDSSATSLTFGPYGNSQGLYYTTYAGGGQIWVISYASTGNTVPTANGTAMPVFGAAPLMVTFSAAGSSDPDPGDTLTYFWDFGDGTSTSTAAPGTTHTYVAAGSYTASLRVRDNHFAFSAPLDFAVAAGNTPPVPQILAPASDAKFAAGQVITLSGSATDPEEGALAGTALSWRVILHHDQHTHPFFGPVTGASVQFTAPAPEDLAAAANSHLEIQLTATDAQGAPASISQALMPHLVGLTFNTDPAGLAVRVNGQAVGHGQSIASWEAWSVSVKAPPQVSGLQTYYFAGWSDGGASTHALATPAAPAAYTATFSTTALVSVDADANGDYDALTDGLLILRRLFGLNGAALTDNALGGGALRTDPVAVAGFIDAEGPAMDVDGDGTPDALTDGVLLIRYLFGLRGQQLIQGAVAAGASRTTDVQIENHIASLLP